MKRILTALLLSACVFCVAAPAGTDVWCPHVTAAGGWKTSISIYNPGYSGAMFFCSKYDNSGGMIGTGTIGLVGARSWTTLSGAVLNYEGTFHLSSADNLLVKAVYQSGDSPSVCEFFLGGEPQTTWVIPNTVLSWMDYTGVALVNAQAGNTTVTFSAWKNGVKVAPDLSLNPAGKVKIVRVSGLLFPGLGYADLDTIVVTATNPIPAPISITGNTAGDRHLFFSGRPQALSSGPVEPESFRMAANRRPRAWEGGTPTRGPAPVGFDGIEAAPEATTFWCSHVTAAGGWKTSLALYNGGSASVTYNYSRYDLNGNAVGLPLNGSVPARSWMTIPSTSLNYEGSLSLSATGLLVKAVYRFGDSPSVCEFFLSGNTAQDWVLPNAVRPWMNYTGVALVNSTSNGMTATLEAWKAGKMVAYPVRVEVAPHAKYVNLSSGIWPGVGYDGIDTVVVRSNRAIACPIDITGNTAGDRHLFFAAQSEPVNGTAGDLVANDALVGKLRFCPTGLLMQGSASGEPCTVNNDNPAFAHLLTRKIAAMETEVTRGMWAALRAVQPTLPADPSHDWGGDETGCPVQCATWMHAVLFANRLSVQQGFQPCYYTDPQFQTPVTASNYNTGPYYCDFDAMGYRLPTEGEWEHFARAGTSTSFWIAEPAYGFPDCTAAGVPGYYPALESAGWFETNAGERTHPTGQKAANGWGIRDVIGNVSEWCWDWLADYPATGQVDYRGPNSGTKRILRSGGFDQRAMHCRSASRASATPASGLMRVGFRLVRTLP
ncbi:MAG: formylglycine-generating enzyme family protein [Acidobacteria bacterium]|nr:formylglycine-generating enzyme family protein [Acidobacteriota bacterium]